jgi:hypothetical protein
MILMIMSLLSRINQRQRQRNTIAAPLTAPVAT